MVLREMAAFHATSHHLIKTYPGGLDALAKDCPRVNFKHFVFESKM
jgi:hypothetical protein